MKEFLLFKLLWLPLICYPEFSTAQINGKYMFWEEDISSLVSFKYNGSFNYEPYGKDSLLGRGNYYLSGDTLRMVYHPYSDPHIENCAEFSIQEDDSLDETSDSIDISIKVFDCHTNEIIPFPGVLVPLLENKPQMEIISFNGKSYAEYKEGDQHGKLYLNISQNLINKELTVTVPEYHSLDIPLPPKLSDRSVKIEAKLFYRHELIEEEGGTEEYIIEKNNRKFLRLKAFQDPEKPSIVCLKVKDKWSRKKLGKHIQKTYNRDNKYVIYY